MTISELEVPKTISINYFTKCRATFASTHEDSEDSGGPPKSPRFGRVSKCSTETMGAKVASLAVAPDCSRLLGIQ